MTAQLREEDIVGTPIGGPADPRIRALRATRPAAATTHDGPSREEAPPELLVAGRGALERCFDPVPLARVRERWGNEPFHVARSPRDRGRFADILSLDVLDELLANQQIPRETVFVLDVRRTDAAEFEALPTESEIGRDLASKGASLYFHFIDQFSPSLRAFCDDLEKCLSRPVSAFAFLNPPHAQARQLHWDPLDVIVLQVEGEKVWHVFEPLIALPLAEHDSSAYTFDTKRSMRVTLRPGDTLYVPRGWIHEAESTDDISFSITIGVRPLTWQHVVGEARRKTLQRARIDQALTASVADGARLDEVARAHLAHIEAQASPRTMRERAVNETRNMAASDVALSPGCLSSFFLDESALSKLDFERGTAPCLLEPQPGGRRWVLAGHGRKVILSAPEAAFVRAILARKGRFKLPRATGRGMDLRDLVQRLTAVGFIELAALPRPGSKRR